MALYPEIVVIISEDLAPGGDLGQALRDGGMPQEHRFLLENLVDETARQAEALGFDLEEALMATLAGWVTVEA